MHWSRMRMPTYRRGVSPTSCSPGTTTCSAMAPRRAASVSTSTWIRAPCSPPCSTISAGAGSSLEPAIPLLDSGVAMKAVAYRRSLPSTDAESLLDVTLPEPRPGGRDLLVRVEAVSVNPVDTKIRQRVDPQGADKVLGWDAAGTVVAVGGEVTLFKPGDQVYYAGAIDRPGSNAELQVVDERIAGRKPGTLDMLQAAALPLTTITAWELLFDRFAIARGNAAHTGTVLIVGAAGGVGSMAVQLAGRLTKLDRKSPRLN